MASPGAAPSAPPVVPPVSDDDLVDESFFQCGAEELAIKLIGRYIHFDEDQIVVRILETEAYPEGDSVYNHRFPDDVKSRFRALKGGTLLASGSPLAGNEKFNYIYVTAGPVGTGDVVLLRSCEPILGLEELLKRRRATNSTRATKRNLLINPLRLSSGLRGDSWEFTTDPILYSGEGVRLLPGFVADGERIDYGTRVMRERYEGCDCMLRFVLRTIMNYSYEEKNSLVDYTAPA